MSREIKFRAWDKLEKRMVRVNAIDFKNREFLEIECDDYKSVITCPSGKFPEHFELMQFTGREDKNSKERYEGDIELEDGDIYEIIWSQEYAGFFWRIVKKDGSKAGRVVQLGEPEEHLGNIHDNPKLLKG